MLHNCAEDIDRKADDCEMNDIYDDMDEEFYRRGLGYFLIESIGCT